MPPLLSLPAPPPKLLTIAGSDSGGAAGLQADLKTWTAMGVYGMSAITAVTAQNSTAVAAVHFMSADFVRAQLAAVLSDYGADGVKTGFIGHTDLIVTVAELLQTYRCRHIVVDPVLVNHRGTPLFAEDVCNHYATYLLPLAVLVTPNRHEAALLTNRPVPQAAELDKLRELAQRLQDLGARAVLLKGGRVRRKRVDILCHGRSLHEIHAPYIDTTNTHGAGDTLSAAVCAFLAQGEELETAVRRAHAFTHAAIARAAHWRLGSGHGPLAHF